MLPSPRILTHDSMKLRASILSRDTHIDSLRSARIPLFGQQFWVHPNWRDEWRSALFHREIKEATAVPQQRIDVDYFEVFAEVAGLSE
jgi:hypothetical protein